VHKATRRAYSAVNIERTRPSRTRDDHEVLSELDREFAPYNTRLAQEMGVDLSKWR
jgi:hypothetical protein